MGGPARVSCIWGKCLEEKGYKVELLSDYHEQNSISYKFKQNHILKKTQKLNIINLSLSLFKILKSKNEEILVFNKGNYIIPLLILLKETSLCMSRKLLKSMLLLMKTSALSHMIGKLRNLILDLEIKRTARPRSEQS